MKKYIAYLLPTVVALIMSCNKYDEITAPEDFAVTTSKLTYKVGDSVIFNFNSGPNQIIFYSGEAGKKFDNVARKTPLAGVNKLVFQSSMQQGTLPNNDSLLLLVSNNLKGYDSASIVNATWSNITSRNTKWPTTLSTGFTTSDSIDISDFAAADSINIAFRFIGKKYATAAQRKWQIQNLTVSNKLADGTVTPLFAAPFAGAAITSSFQYTGWVEASLKNNTFPGFNAWNVGTANISAADSIRNSNGVTIKTAYPIQFDPGVTVNNDENDDWLITTKTNLKTVLPDAGIAIKNQVNAAFPGFTYQFNRIPGVYAQYLYFFKTPGQYDVVFVASNLYLGNKMEVVRRIQVTITP